MVILVDLMTTLLRNFTLAKVMMVEDSGNYIRIRNRWTNSVFNTRQKYLSNIRLWNPQQVEKYIEDIVIQDIIT